MIRVSARLAFFLSLGFGVFIWLWLLGMELSSRNFLEFWKYSILPICFCFVGVGVMVKMFKCSKWIVAILTASPSILINGLFYLGADKKVVDVNNAAIMPIMVLTVCILGAIIGAQFIKEPKI